MAHQGQRVELEVLGEKRSDNGITVAEIDHAVTNVPVGELDNHGSESQHVLDIKMIHKIRVS